LLDSGRRLKQIDRRQHVKNKGAEIMRRYLAGIITAAFVATIMSVAISSAQGAGIAFVDMMEFAHKSKKCQEQENKLKAFVTAKQKALVDKYKKLQTLKSDTQRQASMLTQPVRDAKIKEITMKETELKLEKQEAESVVQNKRQIMMQALQTDIQKILKKIRQERKLSLVLNSQALLSADNVLDITTEVASAYDADPAIPSKAASAGNTRPRKAPAAGRKPLRAR
jgi:Skp family chaperone for outer membrane proteins